MVIIDLLMKCSMSSIHKPLGGLSCTGRRKKWKRWIIPFLTLGATLIGAVQPRSTANSLLPVSALRSLRVDIKNAKFYNTSTTIHLNMTNNLQNSNITGSSVGNVSLNMRNIMQGKSSAPLVN